MKKFVFFSMNDFRKEGGGTIRMLGIINELVNVNADITLISNIKDVSKVDERVKHIPLDYEFSREDKRKFQFYLGTMGHGKLNKTYAEFLTRLREVFQNLDAETELIFFEYLDNSIGYWLKKNGIIERYINDVHGIASNEFDFQARKAGSLKSKLMFRLKEKISKRLDKKVFDEADGIIYASEAMDDYYKNLYPSLKKKNNIHLPYLLNAKNLKPADPALVNQFKSELNIVNDDFVFLFAGAYKETGGIQDLIEAFDITAERFANAKLILIGDGPTFEECEKLIRTKIHKDRIHLLGRQPYDCLTSYQEISHVLVCPDRQNLFSDLIVHVKYLDALVSGKIVINGSFKSVMEINREKQLSLLFKPSEIDDLAEKMMQAVENYDELSAKFKDARDYTLSNLNYKNFISNMLA